MLYLLSILEMRMLVLILDELVTYEKADTYIIVWSEGNTNLAALIITLFRDLRK